MAPIFETLADRRVRMARSALVLDQPFFGVLALQLALVADASCATAWVDGKSLGYNPAFVDSLSDSELQGLIVHEVLHVACGHPWRRAGRDARTWNVACDYAINAIAVDSAFTLPAGALLSPEYSGRCAEWIFDRLPADSGDGDSDKDGDKDSQDSGDGDSASPDDSLSGDATGDGDSGQPGDSQDSGDSGQPGEVRDAPAGDPDAPTEADWRQTVEQATRVCQAAGSMPGGTARGISKAQAPAVDWRGPLRRYIQQVCTSDYTWTRPNVRYLSSGLFLPSLRSVRCGRLIFAIDTSGSVDEVIASQFTTEVQAAADEVQPESVQVICCDSEVQHVQTFEAGEQIVIELHGGGGTAFQPVFDYVAASDDDAPAVLIYLTDLYGPMPDVAPDYPVIWAVVGDMGRETTPFGDVIAID